MRRDVLVIGHTYFPRDPRLRKQVAALLAEGIGVDVVCLRGDGEPARETWQGARLYRLPVRRHRGAGALVYALEYLAFLMLALFVAARLSVQQRYRVAHVHNLPDVLVFAALVPRLLGARVLLDIHDFMPELFMTRYGLARDHPVTRLLRGLEAASCAFAHGVVCTHDLGRERLIGAGVRPGDITVIMNTAPLEGAAPAAAATGRSGVRVVYAGLLSDIYDLESAVRAVAALRPELDASLLLVGGGPERERLERLAAASRHADGIRVEAEVPHHAVRALLEQADIGYAVLHEREHQHIALPTKMFEYIAAGLPVVTSRTRVMERYFDDDAVCYVAAGDVNGIAQAIRRLADPAERRRRAVAARAATWPIRWEEMARRYVQLVRSGA